MPEKSNGCTIHTTNAHNHILLGPQFQQQQPQLHDHIQRKHDAQPDGTYQHDDPNTPTIITMMKNSINFRLKCPNTSIPISQLGGTIIITTILQRNRPPNEPSYQHVDETISQKHATPATMPSQ